jgi:hypothetical protein
VDKPEQAAALAPPGRQGRKLLPHPQRQRLRRLAPAEHVGELDQQQIGAAGQGAAGHVQADVAGSCLLQARLQQQHEGVAAQIAGPGVEAHGRLSCRQGPGTGRRGHRNEQAQARRQLLRGAGGGPGGGEVLLAEGADAPEGVGEAALAAGADPLGLPVPALLGLKAGQVGQVVGAAGLRMAGLQGLEGQGGVGVGSGEQRHTGRRAPGLRVLGVLGGEAR